MEYGWVNLNTAQRASRVKTPGAVARVQQDSEAFVAVDREVVDRAASGPSAALELTVEGRPQARGRELEQVVQTGDLLSEPAPLPARPRADPPADNLELDLDRVRQLVLVWKPVKGAARYALQVSRNQLFVDNVIDVENRAPRPKRRSGLRGEGTFQWRVAAYRP